MKGRGISVVEVSGEHPNLPISEVLGSLRGMGHVSEALWYEPRFLALRSQGDLPTLASRLAFGRYVGRARLWGSPQEVQERLPSLDLEGRRFRFRVADAWGGSTKGLEASLGARLAATGEVDLQAPEVDLRLVGVSRAYLYQVSAVIDRGSFEARAPRNRPFTRPISLHPRFARALVNLTGVAPGETLLDPFCGTGGILMEASLVGAHPVGADLREEVVEGCGRNLAFFGVDAELHVSDVGQVAEQVGPVQAIATDPPYGRGATTRGEDLASLLERAFAAFQRLLTREGRLAIAFPDPELIDLGRRHLTLLEWHRVRVHRSLDRYLCLFRQA